MIETVLEFMHRTGCSINWLADQLEVSNRQICRIKTGWGPGPYTRKKFAEFLEQLGDDHVPTARERSEENWRLQSERSRIRWSDPAYRRKVFSKTKSPANRRLLSRLAKSRWEPGGDLRERHNRIVEARRNVQE